MSAPHDLSVLILSEDSGEQIHAALRALLKKMFQLLDGECGTHRVDFQPADEDSRRALRGRVHGGKKGTAHSHRVLLAGKVADQLARQQPSGFVAYHSDGDHRWSERGAGDFPDFDRLRAAVVNRLSAPRRVPGEAIDATRIERLLLLSPYWELEAWLYQNLARARQLCGEHDKGTHLALFDKWEKNRAAIDEEKDPKEACCLRDRHNQALAESAFPREAAYDAGASFAATVDRWRACGSLLAALERTHAA